MIWYEFNYFLEQLNRFYEYSARVKCAKSNRIIFLHGILAILSKQIYLLFIYLHITCLRIFLGTFVYSCRKVQILKKKNQTLENLELGKTPNLDSVRTRKNAKP